MSLISASNMEIEIEQCGSASTVIDDINKLIWFVRRYNNTLPEYIRVARMYFFGTPIRRTGAGFRRATPGCVGSSSINVLARYDRVRVRSETATKHPSTRHAGAFG